ncbi:hypothetical protein SEUCBS139899_005685 [Sporothrix eucalyptigena]|uniref:Lea domain containing protein n=1 Tax=Sporothrix eucalyptigena TaxID=1812306 RepID=A0ABP0AWB3_9PEZI
MSFLTEITLRRVAMAAPRISTASMAPRTMAASTLHMRQNRYLSSTTPRPKTPAEAAKQTLKSVDRAVSDKLVEGIDMGTAVAGKVKEVSKDIKDGKIKDKAEQFRHEAEAKANEFKHDAQAKGEQLKHSAKDKANEAAEKTRQAAEEVKKRT